VDAAAALPFDTRAGFQGAWRALLEQARVSLALIDPDAALFELGASTTDAALRRFLAGGGTLRLVLHEDAHLRRHAPRFLRLLRDHRHRIECRQTPRALRLRTDSFAIADDRHIVRRFHSEHMRGSTSADSPQELEPYRELFEAIWIECLPALYPDVTGL
jgi:hypothetical protein